MLTPPPTYNYPLDTLASEYTNDINANMFPQNIQHVEGYIVRNNTQYNRLLLIIHVLYFIY